MFWIQVKQKRLTKATLVVCSRNRRDWSKLYSCMSFCYKVGIKYFLPELLTVLFSKFFWFSSNLYNVTLIGYNPVLVIALLIPVILVE
jgi:hypothetical protein